MNELWYNNPNIILKNLDEFFPDNHLNLPKKINSIVRFSIYFSILIIILGYNINYLYFSLLLIIISYLIGIYFISIENEKFNETNINETNITEKCKRPTKNNPFMNLTLSDLIDNNHTKACQYDDVKNEIRSNFRKDLYTDTSDLWGKYISDRNFYTMPNTEIVNNQTEFAEWLYGDHSVSGNCKEDGNNCLKRRDPTFNRGRITTENEDNILF